MIHRLANLIGAKMEVDKARLKEIVTADKNDADIFF